ncbi:helix-turn-helix domain-containing protein [Empedobacter tilapiae]|uniref:DNA-binding protein n=1 Tax=Empedobacter tilapiae TaxID=2491114 RepID=A0A4Z1BBU6_9FLAO|nr:helix-turn-helix domain-containing protein [Empedobacter tilapiae]TGN29176.1 DNA-binding protein [Empedobacter tilapiae]
MTKLLWNEAFIQQIVKEQVLIEIAKERNDLKEKDIYLTKEQAAAMFGVSTSTIDNYKRNNLIPYTKIGRAVRFTLFDLKNAPIFIKKGKK